MWSDVRGPVNVAPSGAVSLSRILRIARRPSLPVPQPLFAPAIERVGRGLGVGTLLGDATRLLRYGRGVDNRRMLDEIGYRPRHDAVSVVRDFAMKSNARRVGPSLHLGSWLGRAAGAGP